MLDASMLDLTLGPRPARPAARSARYDSVQHDSV